MSAVLFVHVPKTAGSSLNESVEQHLGANAIVKDYGPDEPHTSQLVHQHIYGPATVDIYGFYQAFLADGKEWLAGHFNADRYINFLKCSNTISFVRAPVDRVISEYLYLQRIGRLDRPFEEFYRSPSETNKQFRMVGQFPWQAFHLVGTQERYSDCLQFLNRSLALPLTAIEKNRREDDAHLAFDDRIRADVKRWNERDHIFYNAVTEYLRKQLDAAAHERPFCYHDVGFEPGRHAIGWAFYADTDQAVDVGLYVDGERVTTVLASEYREQLHMIGAPRHGHLGFRFVLAPYKDARTIKLKAQKTDQTLFEWSDDAG